MIRIIIKFTFHIDAFHMFLYSKVVVPSNGFMDPGMHQP